VEEVSFKDGRGVYTVTLPEGHKFDPAAVKKAVGRFTLERTHLKVAGDVAKDDKGVWLTSTSGVKLLLANRPKKDEKDTPPDVLAKIEEGIKNGTPTFAIAGEVMAAKDATTVHLDTAEVVVKEKK
jgi:hypothetical protein